METKNQEAIISADDNTNDSKKQQDFRAPTEAKKVPKAVADGIGGMPESGRIWQR